MMYKTIFNLPFACHTKFVESLTKIPHLQSTLHSCYIGFLKKLDCSKKVHIQMLLALSKNDLTSNTGLNISYLFKKYECTDLPELLSKQNHVKLTRVYKHPKEEQWKANMIEELCLMNLGLIEGPIEKDEIEFLLEELCTK